MMAEQIRVHGLKELGRKLEKLPNDMARKALQKGVNAGADVTKREARARVPVDTGYIKSQIRRRAANKRLGKLARAAAVGVLTDEKAGGLQLGTARKNRKRRNGVSTGLTGFANSDAYYWRFLEFGTSKMSARPFIRPAFESTKSQQIEKLKGVLKIWLYNPANRIVNYR